jgi:hypothetical protein
MRGAQAARIRRNKSDSRRKVVTDRGEDRRHLFEQPTGVGHTSEVPFACALPTKRPVRILTVLGALDDCDFHQP